MIDTCDQPVVETQSDVCVKPLPARFAAFVRFHRDNPRVYELFKTFAIEAKNSGRKRFGARMIGERVRWYTTIETVSSCPYKVNDHHWPYYARLLVLEHPSMAGFFTRRDEHFDATDQMILSNCAANRDLAVL